MQRFDQSDAGIRSDASSCRTEGKLLRGSAMYTINHNNKPLASLAISFLVLLALVGCKRNVIEAGSTSILPGLSRPVRVSSGDMNAAEPAIASSSDGSVYVVWVNHGPKSQANVMIARFNRDGQMQDSAVRVNSEPGIATAWRGDPPTVAVHRIKRSSLAGQPASIPETGHATDIYLSSSRPGSDIWRAVKVNDDKKAAVHGIIHWRSQMTVVSTWFG